VLYVLYICLVGSIIKILKHTPDKFVFANFQGPFRKSSRVWVSPELNHKPRSFEVPVIGGNVQRRVVVKVLPVKDLLQEKLYLVLEVL